ncbi:MAG: hypothetical protein IPJ82_02860 [Lewinellaceae bacterium]|nr:hypothetical protein [Lewinellaceae bacterium]
MRKSQVAGPDGQGAVCRGLTFHRPFKRIEVMDENHLVWLVYYIHNNPRKHGVLQDFTHYAWSSYASLLSQSQTNLARELVFDLFAGGKILSPFIKVVLPEQRNMVILI